MTTTKKVPNSERPVYVLTETPSQTCWTKVGTAVDNDDGSVTVKLDASPLNATLQIKEASATPITLGRFDRLYPANGHAIANRLGLGGK